MTAINPPSWFDGDTIAVSTAPTCGLAKGGRLLPRIDDHGQRIYVRDADTGEEVVDVDDVYLADAEALIAGERTATLRSIPVDEVSMRTAVPVYYDRRFHERFVEAMKGEKFADFEAKTIRRLLEENALTLLHGHGSPGREERVGDVPYIKVSDLRAGLVNINPTNRVPRRVAEEKWRGTSSGLEAFDILSPARTSKNIGDFCVLMPGQERVVLTKEIIVLRPGEAARFDSFYLLWALTLSIVREQWQRVVFMQTNREDVGARWLEIEVPVARTREIADATSEPFRNYYNAIAGARTALGNYLRRDGEHHFFISGAEAPEPGANATVAAGEIAEDVLDPED
jgi:type I restriction enzyme M protein